MKRITIVLCNGTRLSARGNVNSVLRKFASAIGCWEEILHIEEV